MLFPRLEDDRLLTGQGRFVANLALPGMLHAAVLRSPHAHAGLSRVETTAARAMPGVEAVYTCADIEAAGVRPLGFLAIVPAVDGGPMSAPPRHALARDRVRYVGEPVALVVARSRHQALDAAVAHLSRPRNIPPCYAPRRPWGSPVMAAGGQGFARLNTRLISRI